MAQHPRVHSHLARYLYNTSSWPPPLPSITKESSPITINQLAPSSSKPTNQESPTSVQRSSATTDDEDDSVMGNSLRCCLACMVPCGALDVVRVVHLSGRVDEFSCPVAAAAVLAANPSHTLTTAWSPSGAPGCGSRKLAIVSPDADLKRGRIYFLIPSATLPAERRGKTKQSSSSKRPSQSSRRHRHHAKKQSAGGTAEQDNYLRELLSEKHASSGAHRRRRSGARVGVWRPRLESIVEEASD